MAMQNAFIFSFALIAMLSSSLDAQVVASKDFREVVTTIFTERYHKDFEKTVCPITEDWVAARVFREYGAMFVAGAGARPPARCMATSEADLAAIQMQMDPRSVDIGGVTVTLQRAAMNALLEARAAATKRRLSITPRGGSTASARSYAQTVDLWRSRFEPALDHWVRKGKIKRAEGAAVRKASIRQQIETVLEWEDAGIYFSKDLSKSILYSVAIPGASQHNFMLAIDVEQFGKSEVRRILAAHGWFRTVKSDLPHFTFLGLKEEDLPMNGLKSVIVNGQKFWIPNLAE